MKTNSTASLRRLHQRAGWLVLSSLIFLVIIVVRLVDIQLLRGDDFLNLADENRYFQLEIPAKRGVFFDRYQEPLVWNKRNYFHIEDTQALHSLTKPISRDQALELMATASGQVGFGVERNYRFGPALSHVLGYVGPVTTADLLADSSLKVSDVIGKIGLEQVFETQLRGQAGSEVYEINALGRRQRLVSSRAGVAGKNIPTTLDPYLSRELFQAFGQQFGAGIIMDADRGEILSLVSVPSFEANALSSRFMDPVLEKQRQLQLQAMLSDPLQVFFNRAISGVYPPGSVFKLVTALGGLEAQVVDGQTQVLDEGILRVGEYEYKNWYFTQYGRTEGDISLQRALARSNDIYFYKVAELLGPWKLAEFARLLGLGKETGVELSGEAKGRVPDPEWKERVFGEPWYLGNTFHMGIGQGDILVTPLQIAQMTQAVANQGTLCRASLLKQDTGGNCTEVGAKEENLNLVLAGMLDTCSAGGTAYPFFTYNQTQREAQAQSPGQEIQHGAIACKTGTAEFGEANNLGQRKTHGWLTAVVGTAPIKALAAQVAAGDQEVIKKIKLRQSEDGGDLTQNNESGLGNSVIEVGGVAEVPELNYLNWLKLVDEVGLPDKLVITVLVESDEKQPFKEGSREAGEIVKKVLNWMLNGVE